MTNPATIRTAADETEAYRLIPRLAPLTVNGEDVQAGDWLWLDRHSAGFRVEKTWCEKINSEAWDRYTVRFRKADFPWTYGRLSPTFTYTVNRSGVYVEGWTPQDCDNRRRELESANA